MEILYEDWEGSEYMKPDLSKNTAERVFESNIGSIINVRLIKDDLEFTGALLKIFCNTFIIHTESNKIEMFRYEDVEWLRVIEKESI